MAIASCATSTGTMTSYLLRQYFLLLTSYSSLTDGYFFLLTGYRYDDGYFFLLTGYRYDDPEIIAGTGTLGIEMLEQLSNADVAVIPVGGGGH